MKLGEMTIEQLVHHCRGESCHNCILCQICPVRFDFPSDIDDKTLNTETGIHYENISK